MSALVTKAMLYKSKIADSIMSHIYMKHRASLFLSSCPASSGSVCHCKSCTVRGLVIFGFDEAQAIKPCPTRFSFHVVACLLVDHYLGTVSESGFSALGCINVTSPNGNQIGYSMTGIVTENGYVVVPARQGPDRGHKHIQLESTVIPSRLQLVALCS